jgi:protein O-mannosyl-transferase
MRKKLYALLVLVSAGLIAYSAAFTVPFQFDDYPNIANNPVLKNLGNFFLSSKGYGYNPRRFVGYLTLALNYRFGGLDVTGYHIVNLAIHLINGILVYFLIILTFKTPYFTNEHKSSPACRPASLPAKDRAYGDSEIESPGTPAPESSALCALPYAPHAPRFTPPDSRFFIALFAALLFVVHPIQTQAVTYIVQRFTSMAAMFYLLSVVMYAKARLSSRQAGRLASFFLSLLSAVLAMKTKEIAFTLPVVIVLYEFSFFKSSLKKKLLFLLPVLLTLVIIPVSVMGTHKPLGELLSDLSASTRVQTNIPRWDYLMTQMRVIVTYIRLIFLPVNQNLDYDYPIFHSLSQLPVILSSLFLLSIFGTAVYLLYKSWQAGKLASLQAGNNGSWQACKLDSDDSRFTIHVSRLIFFGILWFFITLSVESSVIPIADVIFEHRVYLPSVGAFMAISAAAFIIVGKVRSRRQAGKSVIYALPVLVVVLLTGATFARNSIWKNEAGLWSDVVRKSPDKLRPHYDLGLAYENQGETRAAVREYQIALQINPTDAETHNNIGGIYFQQDRMEDALKEYQTALKYRPGSDTAHYNAGNAYFSLGRLDEAMREYKAALKINPDDAAAHNNLGVVYLMQGRLDEALGEIGRALKLDPQYADARVNLAKVLGKMNEQGYYRSGN